MDYSIDQTYEYGQTALENALFRVNHFTQLKVMYDANYLEFKQNPTLSLFIKSEEVLKQFHLERGQTHLKFFFPENNQIDTILEEYLKQNRYQLDRTELYVRRPVPWISNEKPPQLMIKKVTHSTPIANDYLDLQYRFCLTFGQEYALGKTALMKEQINNPSYAILLAYWNEIPIGFIHGISIDESTFELDNFQIDESYQRKGIGTHLQAALFQEFPKQTAILLADGQDSPKEMYKKQGYQFQSFMYEALKE
ncbi:GNAT family N-acetyltransferase [Alkalihalobacillus pseudalcaliphilus]|uniref:GNAT family N-acetyltransferase n=1 Tax=Alkalihalobacillus pseudalcaliphilus TaxID=79884 RepID=UPI00064E0100|nr:GNAT family N-acetyltransferase [Alkalihalobacillus pseudalcaliphilus]KMK75511.1 hypothetical protein AB990_09430 [Alkalihalobacillus pseudalcaliphilus]